MIFSHSTLLDLREGKKRNVAAFKFDLDKFIRVHTTHLTPNSSI